MPPPRQPSLPPDERSTVASGATPDPSLPPERHSTSGDQAPPADYPVIAGFEILSRLGSGGMGQVYKARALDQDRVVALKIIRADRSDETHLVQRFRREAKAGRRLDHPNIVAFHDDIRAGELHCLTMEFIDGNDLARLVETNGRLAIDLACDCVRQAALGLQHAHERGLIHRDIKPSNLVLTKDESIVKILDMGLARLGPDPHAGDMESELTHSGMMMGTLAYMAPEQAFDARNADGRADIYSLGCTLYHLLTGAPPHRHQMREPDPLHWARASVSPVLSAIVRRMMARLPEDRYATALDVARALAPFCRSRLRLPMPEGDSTCDGPIRTARPKRLGYWICGAAGVAVLIVSAIWLASALRP